MLCRPSGRRKDPDQLLRFVGEVLESPLRNDPCIAEHFQPEQGFIGLFQDDGYLRSKLRP